MKKLLVLLLALVTVSSLLAACVGETNTAQTEAPTTEALPLFRTHFPRGRSGSDYLCLVRVGGSFRSFRKSAAYQRFSASNKFQFDPHPSGMRLKSEGLSHGLTKCPPDTLLPCFR